MAVIGFLCVVDSGYPIVYTHNNYGINTEKHAEEEKKNRLKKKNLDKNVTDRRVCGPRPKTQTFEPIRIYIYIYIPI